MHHVSRLPCILLFVCASHVFICKSVYQTCAIACSTYTYMLSARKKVWQTCCFTVAWVECLYINRIYRKYKRQSHATSYCKYIYSIWPTSSNPTCYGTNTTLRWRFLGCPPNHMVSTLKVHQTIYKYHYHRPPYPLIIMSTQITAHETDVLT